MANPLSLQGLNVSFLNAQLSATVKPEGLSTSSYVCIGSYEDKPKNRVYYYVNDKVNNYDCILEYDLMLDSVKTIYQDGRPSSSGNISTVLNFREDQLITGINKIDDILYWTDNFNRPRKINVELAKKNELNINNPKFIFRDTFYRNNLSTIFIGNHNNEDDTFKVGDYVYASCNEVIPGFNGYAEVTGLIPKAIPVAGTTSVSGATSLQANEITINTLSETIPDLEVGNFLPIYGVNTATNTPFPYIYKVTNVNFETGAVGISPTFGNVSGSSSTNNNGEQTGSGLVVGLKDVDDNYVSGIITNCPWAGSFSKVSGKMVYANPKDAYSPLISFGDAEQKQLYFDVVKHQPHSRPSINSSKDAAVATNNILDDMFQFKYRYLYEDNGVSSYSGISDIDLDDNFALNSVVSASDYQTINNRIDITYEDSISDVVNIEIVARKGNDGEFFLIDTVPNNFIKLLKKLKNSLIDNDSYDYLETDSTNSFFNDGTYPFVDKQDSNKLFDAVPKLAKGQTILSNNRIAYGNVVEGYDNTNVIVSSEFATFFSDPLSSSFDDIPISHTTVDNDGESFFNQHLGGGSEKTKHKQKFNLASIDLDENFNQTVELNYSWSYKRERRFAGDITRNGTFNVSLDVTGAASIDDVGQLLEAHIDSGFDNTTFSGGSTNGTVSAHYISSEKKLKVTFEYANSNSGGNTFSSINFDKNRKLKTNNKSKFISGSSGRSTFKTGAFHSFGISYFDETNRCSFVNVAPNYSSDYNGSRPYNKFYTEQGGFGLSEVTSLVFNIFNRPPIWATDYQLCYTGNNTVDEFIQMSIINVKRGTGEDTQIYLGLQSLKGQNFSYNEVSNSLIDYQFAPGDRVRFISYKPSNSEDPIRFVEYIDVEISGSDLYIGGSDEPINVSGNSEGFYIRIPDPEVTAVEDDNGDTVSIAHSDAGSISGTGYEGLFVEIYRPKKEGSEEFNVYYEVGGKKPIIAHGTDARRHSGNHSDQGSEFIFDTDLNLEKSDIGATVIIGSHTNNDIGDVYVKPRSMATSSDGSGDITFFPEDYYLNDFHNTNHYNRGRINVINNKATERRLEASVYYSEPYSSTGSINGLSNFNLANVPYFDYNKDFGSIQFLSTRNDDLMIFHENKVGRVLVGKDILNTASGDGLVSLSNNIIDNYVQLYAGDFGCCLQPESVVKAGNKFYFVDIKRGAVLRLGGDGLTAISNNGMRDYFRDIGEMYAIYDPEKKSFVSFNLIAGYDHKYEEYIVTFPNVETDSGAWQSDINLWDQEYGSYQNIDSSVVFESKTVAFNEGLNKWTSFYDYYPDYYASVAKQFISFKGGRLFKHNTTDRNYQKVYNYNMDDYTTSSAEGGSTRYQNRFNYFHGKQYSSLIQFPFNVEPSTVKTYNALSLEGDSKLFASMSTNIGQTLYGPDLKDGYDSTIKTSIQFKRVDGLIENYQHPSGFENLIRGVDTNFFKDVRVGDFVKIYGYSPEHVDEHGNILDGAEYIYKYKIVKAIVSNTILKLTSQVHLSLDGNHMEVIDFKTKEGIHYSNIPFVKSDVDVDPSYSDNVDYGDGSEIEGIGFVDQLNQAGSTLYFSGAFNAAIYSMQLLTQDMTVGAEYVLISLSFNEPVFDLSSVSVESESTSVGDVFICERPAPNTFSLVISTDSRLYIQKEDGTTLFLGYPTSSTADRFIFVKDKNLSTEDIPNKGFLFVVKKGNIEGERMKGQYMMTTLSSEPEDKNMYFSKYKFNLYAANADVDKSELSNK